MMKTKVLDTNELVMFHSSIEVCQFIIFFSVFTIITVYKCINIVKEPMTYKLALETFQTILSTVSVSASNSQSDLFETLMNSLCMISVRTLTFH